MKKIYMAPQVSIYEMGPESALMNAVSSSQTTGAFGGTTKTQSEDPQNSMWDTKWTEVRTDNEED